MASVSLLFQIQAWQQTKKIKILIVRRVPERTRAARAAAVNRRAATADAAKAAKEAAATKGKIRAEKSVVKVVLRATNK
jgi:hypothetical protein